MQTTVLNTDKLVETARKYSRHVPMYIEYPHKRFWSEAFAGSDLLEGLAPLASEPAPLMLYLHFPYCERQCFYCTCHTEINHDEERSREYLRLLIKEIDLYQKYFDAQGIDPHFVEVHLGGGSPSLLGEDEFDALVGRIDAWVGLPNLREFAIEIDPRHTDAEKLRYYHSVGINRISLGIQDFEPTVQKAINRIQPEDLIWPMLSPEVRGLFSHGINFDILCGLPNQTSESIQRTFATVLKMAPDRICLNHLHFAPHFAPHQRFMVDGKNGRPMRLPNYVEKRILFREAEQVLKQGGYLRTGFDHFAKPEDDVARALCENKMHWNSLGVTAGAYEHILGVGPHSTTTLPDRYAQNVYGTKNYRQRVLQGEFPVFRGYVLNREDTIRRDVIQTLRNFSSLCFADIEGRYEIDFSQYFAQEMERLDPLVDDGLVEVSPLGIKVTDLGTEFVLFVCEQFDGFRLQN